MSDSKKKSFIQFLVSEPRNKSRQNDCLQKTFDDLSDRLRVMQLTLDKIKGSQNATHAENLQLTAQLSDQCACLKSMRSELQKTLGEVAKYRVLYEVLRNEKFVGTSQKSLTSCPEAGRDDNKDDWDGTGNAGVAESTSDSASGSVTSSSTVTECSSSSSSDGATTIEVEHICCTAHVRAEFPKALLQGNHEQARPFMEWMGKLYDLKRGYSKDHLPPWHIE